jgi:hypothetical protein
MRYTEWLLNTVRSRQHDMYRLLPGWPDHRQRQLLHSTASLIDTPMHRNIFGFFAQLLHSLRIVCRQQYLLFGEL